MSIETHSSSPSRALPRALLVAHRGAAHHLTGVGSALRNAGWVVESETLQGDVPVLVSTRSIERCDIVVHVDSDPASTLGLRARAEARSVPTVMQIDGVLEFANTFLNPRFGNGLLQPAPADLVLASGAHDQVILEALGNRASANGLPRFDAFIERWRTCQLTHEPKEIMIATANQPWFTRGMRARLMLELEQLQAQTQHMQIPVRWRVAAEIAEALGIERDTAELVDSLQRVEGVITTASSLAFEAMLADKPVGVLHPYPWPLWFPCVSQYHGARDIDQQDDLAQIHERGAAVTAANEAAATSISKVLANAQVQHHQDTAAFIESVLHPESGMLEWQRRILQGCVNTGAAEGVPEVLNQLRVHKQLTGPITTNPVDAAADERVLIEAVESLARAGSRRVVIAANTLPTEAMRSIANCPPEQLVGFAVPVETDQEVLLGLPAAGVDQYLEQLMPDGIVLTAPEDDLSILAAMLWETPEHIAVVDADPSNPKFARARDAIEHAKRSSLHGEVRSTLDAGVCQGMACTHSAGVLAGDPPAMILLRGDEEDFEVYQRAQQLRASGTLVRSLRWSDAELRACERFAQLVHAFEAQPYAIYGGGLHTTHLLRHALIDSRPMYILDDGARVGARLEGIEVIAPADPRVGEVSRVVISSQRHESAIWERCGALREQGVEVHRLYDGVLESEPSE